MLPQALAELGKIRKEKKEEKTNKQKNKKIVDTVFISLTTLLIKTQSRQKHYTARENEDAGRTARRQKS